MTAISTTPIMAVLEILLGFLVVWYAAKRGRPELAILILVVGPLEFMLGFLIGVELSNFLTNLAFLVMIFIIAKEEPR